VNGLYLDLVERLLIRDGFSFTDDWSDLGSTTWTRFPIAAMEKILRRRGYRMVAPAPLVGETLASAAALRNVRECCETVLAEEVPGDFAEAGVWRGGVTILMRAVLSAWPDTERNVWVADTFAGVPPPSGDHAIDADLDYHEHRGLAVSLEDVSANFARYELLDDQVSFLTGRFAETLPGSIKCLSVLRVDADLYESTWDALSALCPLVSDGGFVLLDDYGFLPATRQAVDDYRREHSISHRLVDVDGNSAFWRVMP